MANGNGESAVVRVTKVEQMNQAVRSVCVILLTLTFCWAFLWGMRLEKPVVSTDAFVGILAAAVTWLFKSRDEEHARSAALPPATNGESK